MPKVQKDRTRRHGLAANSSVEAKAVHKVAKKQATVAAFSQAEAQGGISTGTAAKALANVLQEGGVGSPAAASAAAAGGGTVNGFVKRESGDKKTKRLVKRKSFLTRLMLPGASEKFQPGGGKQGNSAAALSSMSPLTDALELMRQEFSAEGDDVGGGGGKGGGGGGLVGGQKGQKKQTTYLRQSIAKSEKQQFAAVLGHGAFQANPLASLRLHLQNQLDAQKVQEEAKASAERKRGELEARHLKQAAGNKHGDTASAFDGSKKRHSLAGALRQPLVNPYTQQQHQQQLTGSTAMQTSTSSSSMKGKSSKKSKKSNKGRKKLTTF